MVVVVVGNVVSGCTRANDYYFLPYVITGALVLRGVKNGSFEVFLYDPTLNIQEISLLKNLPKSLQCLGRQPKMYAILKYRLRDTVSIC